MGKTEKKSHKQPYSRFQNSGSDQAKGGLEYFDPSDV